MIVDIDIGNSFAKWRVAGECAINSQLTSSLVEGWQVNYPTLERVRIASVTSSERLDALRRQIRLRWSIEPEIAHVTRDVAVIQPAYKELHRLGVDRWLAMIAAYDKLKAPCVVVSAGTALTADWVEAGGRHLGGYIAPGYQKLLDVLHLGVANVLRDKSQLSSDLDLSLGDSTENCVLGGVSAMVSGFLLQVTAQRPGFLLMLTGGDAKTLLLTCAQQHNLHAQLLEAPVLDGLAIALP